MPPKGDTPCSRCGRLLVSTAGSRPAGERVCHPCRREVPAPYKNEIRSCAWCGIAFHHSDARVQTCSRSCGQKLRSRDQARSPEERRAVERERWRKKNRMRRADDIVSEPYTLVEIAVRDGYRCGICRRKVNMKLTHPHPKSPTVDHIIPLSTSRDDTRVNVQLAHSRCNIAKNVRAVGEQLALVG